jgi:hypothetical protein
MHSDIGSVFEPVQSRPNSVCQCVDMLSRIVFLSRAFGSLASMRNRAPFGWYQSVHGQP